MDPSNKFALVLRLAGPMQAWGIQSRFEYRDTGIEPSRSGVIGLLGCSLGIGREDKKFLSRCMGLEMGVLVLKEGAVLRDYHVSGGGKWKGREYGVATANGKSTTVVSNRYYLSDADFLVGLIGEPGFIGQLSAGVKSPVWPIFLGRKAFVPSHPVFVATLQLHDMKEVLLEGLSRLAAKEGWLQDSSSGSSSNPILSNLPWLAGSRQEAHFLRMQTECDQDAGTEKNDVPLSFSKLDKRYMKRYVSNTYIDPAAILGKGKA